MEEDEFFEDTMESVDSNALDDIKKEDQSDPASGTILSLVQERYNKASTARETEEHRWIQAYRNYRGLYGPDVQFTSTEKSKVFVKVTKTKVLAAYGQIVEVLFGSNKFPISIEPTTLPFSNWTLLFSFKASSLEICTKVSFSSKLGVSVFCSILFFSAKFCFEVGFSGTKNNE